MNVKGHAITDATIDGAICSLNLDGFTHAEFALALIDRGVPRENWVAHRCADRVMQALRKAGKARFSGKTWSAWK